MPTVRTFLLHRLPVPACDISHAIWLYFRFPLSRRMGEEMLAARGIVVSHETVALKFGQGPHPGLTFCGSQGTILTPPGLGLSQSSVTTFIVF